MLQISKAKPNPVGKDRYGSTTPLAQLAGEWVDISNLSGNSVNVHGLELYHRAYTGSTWEWEKVASFHNFTIPAYQVARVHSGKVLPLNMMAPVDVNGADIHVFTGNDYIWNNKQPDEPTLFNPVRKEIIDHASYSVPVVEGGILERNGSSLI